MLRTAIPHVWVPNEYPTSDGKPMAETDVHRNLMVELIETLQIWFANSESTYVSGNMLVFYEPGDKRRHLAPDVFVVTKSHKHERGNFVIWEEGRSLDVVIEVTSKTTMREDLGKKSTLYLTKLGVKEYYLFDPKEEYLKPSFQAFRRVGERFVPIEPVAGRFPSKLLKLHLERSGWQLRLWDPVRKQRVPTRAERLAAAEAEVERLRRLLQQQHRANGHNGH
ncbi:MAG TPA: Uma2 family endonuclease [Gemmataceae bacterium]|jgi:Uma2 family endonuclease